MNRLAKRIWEISRHEGAKGEITTCHGRVRLELERVGQDICAAFYWRKTSMVGHARGVVSKERAAYNADEAVALDAILLNDEQWVQDHGFERSIVNGYQRGEASSPIATACMSIVLDDGIELCLYYEYTFTREVSLCVSRGRDTLLRALSTESTMREAIVSLPDVMPSTGWSMSIHELIERLPRRLREEMILNG